MSGARECSVTSNRAAWLIITSPQLLVRDRLKGLADRGVLRGVLERPGSRGKVAFRIGWLYGRDYGIEVDSEKRHIVFRNMLPAVVYRSYLDSDLRRFVARRSDAKLPLHRRVDSEKAMLRYTNRKAVASLAIQSVDGDTAYAITALLNTAKDLFSYLQLYHIEYLHRQFGLPEE